MSLSPISKSYVDLSYRDSCCRGIYIIDLSKKKVYINIKNNNYKQSINHCINLKQL